MRIKAVIMGILVFVFLMSVAFGQVTDKKADTLKEEEKATTEVKAEPAPSLIGEWVAVVKDSNSLDVGLTVREDGTYTRADVDASVTGPYKLDMEKEPYALDLCVGECGGPGSEWTTLFCIFRFHTADTLELRYSPTEKRPGEFAKEPDKNTVIYVLKREKK